MSAMVFSFFALNAGNRSTCNDDRELSFVLDDGGKGDGGGGGAAAAATNSPFRLLSLFFCLIFLVT